MVACVARGGPHAGFVSCAVVHLGRNYELRLMRPPRSLLWTSALLFVLAACTSVLALPRSCSAAADGRSCAVEHILCTGVVGARIAARAHACLKH